MTSKAGIWIDYQHAILILTSDHTQDVRKFDSGIDVARMQGDPCSGVSDMLTPETRAERCVRIQLHQFFDTVIDCLSDSDAVLIIGPGNAKTEFIRYIADMKLQGLSVETEAAAKPPLSRYCREKAATCHGVGRGTPTFLTGRQARA